MFNKIILLHIFMVFIFSCEEGNKITADEIVNRSIEISGGNIINKSTLDFDFRGIHYTAIRTNNNFKLGRDFIKNNDTIIDWLTNTSFERTINNKAVSVVDSMIPRYSASVNSVHYFSVLPYGLNDDAVNKKLLGQVEIKGETFYKVEVMFNEKGGGEDFEDVFLYYINLKDFKIHYLAYSYNEDDGLGFRFREVFNERIIEGVRFVDYNNYKPANNNIDFKQIDRLFENDNLKLLSKIELKNVKVSSITKN